MSNFRNATRTNFTIVDNAILERPDLSWRAKGLLIYLLSRPHDWRIYTKHLVSAFNFGRNPSGKEAVQSIIKELIETGYIIKDSTRNEAGRFEGISYLVFSEPQQNQGIQPKPAKPVSVKNDQSNRSKSPEWAKPSPDKPASVNPEPTNPPLLNTNLTKKEINKELTNQKKQVGCFIDSGKNEFFIESNLTDDQKSEIRQTIVDLMSQGIRVSNPASLFAEIEYTLLDKKTFTQTENVFARKLAAIRSVIANGRWTRPAGMRSSDGSSRTDSVIASLKTQIHKIRVDIYAVEQALLSDLAQNEYYRRAQEQALEPLQKKLQSLIDQVINAEAQRQAA